MAVCLGVVSAYINDGADVYMSPLVFYRSQVVDDSCAVVGVSGSDWRVVVTNSNAVPSLSATVSTYSGQLSSLQSAYNALSSRMSVVESRLNSSTASSVASSVASSTASSSTSVVNFDPVQGGQIFSLMVGIPLMLFLFALCLGSVISVVRGRR